MSHFNGTVLTSGAVAIRQARRCALRGSGRFQRGAPLGRIGRIAAGADDAAPPALERPLCVLGLAAELTSQEVRLTVRPKRYSFRDARGATQAGTMLQFVTLERLKPRGTT